MERGDPAVIASTARTPTAPLHAITADGGKCSAAAPAAIMATPWPRLMPPVASPNAWLRCPWGVASTNSELAAT